MILIPDIWNIVLQYLNDDVKPETSEFFEKHLNRIYWDGLSKNKSIPIQFFEKHVNKINWNGLSGNTSIPIDLFEKHLNKINWYWLSRNTGIVKQETRKSLLLCNN